MVWNYRVIKHEDEQGELYYAMHECYYYDDADPSSIPHSWTVNPVKVFSVEPEGIQWVLQKMQEAATKPILKIKGKKLIEA